MLLNHLRTTLITGMGCLNCRNSVYFEENGDDLRMRTSESSLNFEQNF